MMQLGMPFPGGIDANANATLLFSIAAAVIHAFILDMRPTTLTRSAVKTLAVALLAVLAVLQGGPWLLAMALALSAIGDAFPSRDGDKAFLAGLASFLAAHLVYVVLFLRIGGGIDLLVFEPWRAALAAAMAVFGLVMLAALWRRVGSGLCLPVVAYAAAILAMGLAALTTGNHVVVGGAILFLVSDGLLAAEKFVVPVTSPNRPLMRHVVWVLYYVAQLAITLGFLL